MSTSTTAGTTTPEAANANSNGGAMATATETANGNISNGNTNGNSNPTRRSGGRGSFQSRNSGGSTFKGAIPSIDTLATKAEKRGIEFASFIKSLHQHVITAFSNPKDVAVAITDFADPLLHMAPSLPTQFGPQEAGITSGKADSE